MTAIEKKAEAIKAANSAECLSSISKDIVKNINSVNKIVKDYADARRELTLKEVGYISNMLESMRNELCSTFRNSERKTAPVDDNDNRLKCRIRPAGEWDEDYSIEWDSIVFENVTVKGNIIEMSSKNPIILYSEGSYDYNNIERYSVQLLPEETAMDGLESDFWIKRGLTPKYYLSSLDSKKDVFYIEPPVMSIEISEDIALPSKKGERVVFDSELNSDSYPELDEEEFADIVETNEAINDWIEERVVDFAIEFYI